jgi:phosphate-selective porin OprO/OprP
MKFLKLLIGIIVLFATFSAVGQVKNTSPYLSFGKGLGLITPDSTFSVNFRFRMQNRAAFKTISEKDFGISEAEMRVRRLRLRLDGFIWNPKLTYLIQLSFSRGDMDFEALGFPNVVRDAYIAYAVTKHLTVGMGQTKLPGNRQRINSSGDLQFVDRSIVNAAFNLDRDFGFQVQHKTKYAVLRGAVSSGEGRNITLSDGGLAYTGRAEFLPFGAFTNGGDYSEGDLAREKTQKVSVGFAYSYNAKATRTGGQLGSMLYAPTDITTQIVDFLYKYNGWSFAAEYMKRTSPNPITENAAGAQKFVLTGHGENYQGGYVFKNHYEIVGRYSIVTPDKEVEHLDHKRENYTLGLNKYLRGHRLKLQQNVTFDKVYKPAGVAKAWIFAFQIELGI